MRGAISCCKDCVAPKRHISCHMTCPEYLHEREIYMACKVAYLKERATDNAIVGTHIKAHARRNGGKR